MQQPTPTISTAAQDLDDLAAEQVDAWLSFCRACPHVLLDHTMGAGGARDCTVDGCGCTRFRHVVTLDPS